MKQDANDPQKIITSKFRASFAHVFKPRKNKQGKEYYTITMLFPKEGTDMTPLKKALEVAAKEKWGDGDKIPMKSIKKKWPIKDGDELFEEEPKKYPMYEGHWYITCNSKQPVGVVGADPSIALTDHNAFYSGCYARAAIRAYGYDSDESKGLTFGLNNVQKMEDGERFSGRSSASDDFDNLGSEDASNYEEGSGEESGDGSFFN